MSSRFTEQVEKKNCKTCGKTIRTQDKLKTECRECVLDRENKYSDEASGYEKQGLKEEMKRTRGGI